jgi:hypothetical protein
MNKTMMMTVLHHQTAGHDIKTANKPFENAAKYRHFRTSVTHQDYIYKSGKSR